MPVYEYKGLNKAGKTVKGILDAESQNALRQALVARGIFVTEVFEGKGSRAAGGSGDVDFRKMLERVTLSDIAVLTRQMATLIRAGIPLVEALNALTDQAEKEELKRTLSDVRRKVNEGSSLANALSDHPKHFSNLYINMVKAGESSGNLDMVLSRLTDFLDAQIELRGKVIGAMIYPVLMMVVGIVVLGLIFTFVIPKVTSIFEDQGAALPWITSVLIGISNILSGYWFVVFPLLIGVVVGFVQWKRTEKGTRQWDRFILKTPVVGPLVRMIAISRFASTLATLLASGVPLLTAMDIVKNILGNTRLVEVIEDARVNIREGESIAQPLKRSGEFPPLVTHMIAVGEASGQLEEMLENVAISYTQQTDIRIQAMTKILEPIMIVGLGVAVAVIVFAVMMPILKLNQTVM
ncbi:type II secretion system protein GspF [Bradymonadaceae bacterium TMQ3]|uniref:Type II secretion system protein GspF n=1 Tax=Lujinxingia sediminis TaxID=2480984 RepID=A0ABY0CTG8_9DELT|nr:type II secretion system inner membrane protein GspF [Lujinxingia sediminis]RDV38555.1 type II secretion system protein GspF [Bradymonadaceae bacterium TMQ3]RVU44897.1 type II secretion system protein GspF [Lujinxingia sediminis]TXC76676.1 type II secretion system protein GspF [Bradymonadales bacterium TMQ1]